MSCVAPLQHPQACWKVVVALLATHFKLNQLGGIPSAHVTCAALWLQAPPPPAPPAHTHALKIPLTSSMHKILIGCRCLHPLYGTYHSRFCDMSSWDISQNLLTLTADHVLALTNWRASITPCCQQGRWRTSTPPPPCRTPWPHTACLVGVDASSHCTTA
jgi:hypothetical protein